GRRNRKEVDETGIRQKASYQTVKAFKNLYPIAWLCSVLKISRSSYYKWLHRKPSNKEIENQKLIKDIVDIYNKYKGIYGYRRIYIYLRLKLHQKVNHKRVYRLMNQLNLKSTIRPKRKRYIKTTPEITAHNILNRKFEEQIPNKKWLTDVTEFKLSNGKKLYLSAIYDLGSKQIISHKLSTSNNNKFVLDTLKKAVKLVPNTEGILLHSDRGYQYTSRLFKVTLEQLGIKQSMSRPGCCIDNGPMEGVW
ncbi:IS3 family transposase, partial [Staphylococcus cohnii]